MLKNFSHGELEFTQEELDELQRSLANRSSVSSSGKRLRRKLGPSRIGLKRRSTDKPVINDPPLVGDDDVTPAEAALIRRHATDRSPRHAEGNPKVTKAVDALRQQLTDPTHEHELNGNGISAPVRRDDRLQRVSVLLSALKAGAPQQDDDYSEDGKTFVRKSGAAPRDASQEVTVKQHADSLQAMLANEKVSARRDDAEAEETPAVVDDTLAKAKPAPSDSEERDTEAKPPPIPDVPPPPTDELSPAAGKTDAGSEIPRRRSTGTVEVPPVPDDVSASDRPSAAVNKRSERNRKRRTTGPKEPIRDRRWYESIFDADHIKTLPPVDHSWTSREADFVMQSLGLTAGASSVLDIGCGTGRLAVEIASRGVKVKGLDISNPLLALAEERARDASAAVEFDHRDFRELDLDADFDAVYCVNSAFGYYDEQANRRVLAAIHRATKPGGNFLLGVVNRDYVARTLPARIWWEGQGCLVLEEVDFNYFTSRIENRRSIVSEDGRQLEHELSVRAYSLHELGRMLYRIGFTVLEVSGNPAHRGRFFGNASRQIYLLCQKKNKDK